jgi:D-alanyl-lipoteichoic acid acyltransferase DltB (MBOAT superfamily)
MIFPSVIFLFAFLPTVLFFYYVPFRKNLQLKNILLLAASIFFYAWGEKWNVLLLIVSVLMNYALGMLADKESRNDKLRKPAVIASAVLNLSLLFVFKYQ